MNRQETPTYEAAGAERTFTLTAAADPSQRARGSSGVAWLPPLARPTPQAAPIQPSDRPRMTIPRSAWSDAAVLTGLIVGINSFLAPSDFGWLHLHPSPYFLLPILIGCRYGFAAGCLAGLLPASIVLFGLALGEAGLSLSAVQAHGYFLSGLILVGCLCGEIRERFRKKEARLTALNQDLAVRLRHLTDEQMLLREAKSELEQVLITQGAELATLDTEIRGLFASDGDELYESVLGLLNRQLQVSDAAFYTSEIGGVLKRRAIIGQSRSLPRRVEAGSIEIVDRALTSRQTVTIPELWHQASDAPLDYLVAVPCLDSQERLLGVLLVTGMPFLALNRKTVRLMSLICRWTCRVAEMQAQSPHIRRAVNGADHQSLFTVDFFKSQLELSFDFCHQYLLPSTIVVFTLPNHPRFLQEPLERLLLRNARACDVPTALDSHTPNLAVLLPFCGLRGAELFRDRALQNCAGDPVIGKRIETRILTVDADRDWHRVWGALTSDVLPKALQTH